MKAVIRTVSFEVSEILDKDWNIDKLLVGIFKVGFEECVSLQRQLCFFVLDKVIQLKDTFSLRGNPEMGHLIDFFHVHRT